MAYVEIVARRSGLIRDSLAGPPLVSMLVDVRGPGSCFAAYGSRCGYSWVWSGHLVAR